MDTKSLTLPPYEPDHHNQAEDASIPRIRNFRQLLATLIQCADPEQSSHRRKGSSYGAAAEEDEDDDELSSALESNKNAIVTIYPTGQLVQLEARPQDVSSFNVNADLLCIFGDGRNRWLDYNKKPCPPPQQLRVPRLVMSPALCFLWQSKLSPTSARTSQLSVASASALNLNNDLMHLIIVQGLSASECRKFIAVETFHEAASTVFNELANGYSVVLVGLMFKSEFENRMLQGKAYQICKSVDELRHWQSRTVMSPARSVTPSTTPTGKDKEKRVLVKELPDEPKRYLGIIC